MTSPGIFIALGANLHSRAGAPRETIEAALHELSIAGVQIERRSRLYETPAWPDPTQPTVVNAVARVRSHVPPRALMELLHKTETGFGRTRSVRNAARTLDLDLLDFEGCVQQGPPTLPHPRMANRAFVLVPLAEVEPGWSHPTMGTSIKALVAALPAAERERVRPL
jgi:2-amino-4-hydroxy-6-hydroxymethyldihydropteridine diphosphokinase